MFVLKLNEFVLQKRPSLKVLTAIFQKVEIQTKSETGRNKN